MNGLTVLAREALWKAITTAPWVAARSDNGQVLHMEVNDIKATVQNSEPYNWVALSYTRDMAFGFDEAGLRGKANTLEEAKKAAQEAAYKVTIATVENLLTDAKFAEFVQSVQVPTFGWQLEHRALLHTIFVAVTEEGIESEDTAFEYAKLFAPFLRHLDPEGADADASARLLLKITRALHDAGVMFVDFPHAIRSTIDEAHAREALRGLDVGPPLLNEILSNPDSYIL